jgi:hypothetical protein
MMQTQEVAAGGLAAAVSGSSAVLLCQPGRTRVMCWGIW